MTIDHASPRMATPHCAARRYTSQRTNYVQEDRMNTWAGAMYRVTLILLGGYLVGRGIGGGDGLFVLAGALALSVSTALVTWQELRGIE